MPRFQQGHRRSAKLSPEQVLEMRELYAQGWSQSRLCQRYGVSIGQVGRIVRNEQWQTAPQIPTEQQLEDVTLDAKESLKRLQAMDPYLEGIMKGVPENIGTESPVSEPVEDPIETILRRRAAQSQENTNAPQSESPVSQASGESSEAPASEPPTAPRPPKAG